jgi:hypothetical protein
VLAALPAWGQNETATDEAQVTGHVLKPRRLEVTDEIAPLQVRHSGPTPSAAAIPVR